MAEYADMRDLSFEYPFYVMEDSFWERSACCNGQKGSTSWDVSGDGASSASVCSERQHLPRVTTLLHQCCHMRSIIPLFLWRCFHSPLSDILSR